MNIIAHKGLVLFACVDYPVRKLIANSSPSGKGQKREPRVQIPIAFLVY